jgi:4-amino-4-deoxy-L-arabinose transferase-like glycosyltransferase
MPPGLNALSKWKRERPYILLASATLLCLLPFSGKAFNIDDTLFVWEAQQIAKHPFDPFGFDVVWYSIPKPMSEETKNPPFAAYYAAGISKVFGWSERDLHLGFLLPGLGVVVGTYLLARRFTACPLLPGTLVLLTPGFLVSATGVMCDTMMVALWVLAAVLWIEGLEREKQFYLLTSAMLMGLSALTKYFGIALTPLLVIYSVLQGRRWRMWSWYFVVPMLMLIAYQLWTQKLYGWGMLSAAYHFAQISQTKATPSPLVRGLVDLSFLGGSTLAGLTFAPLLWSRKTMLVGAALSIAAAIPIAAGWLSLGGGFVSRDFRQRWIWVAVQLAISIAAGISILLLAIVDLWKRRDAPSIFLASWTFGTFIFAGYLNWVNNARSILPLIPAAAILMARHLEGTCLNSAHPITMKIVAPLVIGGVLSLWITWGDVRLANSARQAAALIIEKTSGKGGTVWFQGHWGFQYYMESFGARPVNLNHLELGCGDFLITPENNLVLWGVRPKFVDWRELLEIPLPTGVTTVRGDLGAGFYASQWGPLPFAFGRVPPERYEVQRLAQAVRFSQQSFRSGIP